MITEEQITISILNFLDSCGWRILCFDFPQSGTGIFFSHENFPNEKNKHSLNPDIIAVKNKVAIHLENKIYWNESDVQLLKKLKIHNPYRKSIDNKLKLTKECTFYYGLGLYDYKKNDNLVDANFSKNYYDFVFFVDDKKQIRISSDCLIFNSSENDF